MDVAFTAQHRGGAGEPLVLVHGFTDTWRTWELVLPALEARHDVLAVTLPGHAGGPEIDGDLTDDTLAVAVERAMDDAGFATAHLAGNSLGGYTALRLAARGRARTVVALAPAGGWAAGRRQLQGHAAALHHHAGPRQGRRPARRGDRGLARGPPTRHRVHHHPPRAHPARAHRPPDPRSGRLRRGSRVDRVRAHARLEPWTPSGSHVRCASSGARPTGCCHGRAAAARYRALLPTADWVVLDDVGHCPQLDVPLETAQLILGFTGG